MQVQLIIASVYYKNIKQTLSTREHACVLTQFPPCHNTKDLVSICVNELMRLIRVFSTLSREMLPL